MTASAKNNKSRTRAKGAMKRMVSENPPDGPDRQ